MSEFRNKFKKMLPYDRQKYLEFFEGVTSANAVRWYGVSFQMPGTFEGEDIGLERFLEHFEPLFKQLVLKFEGRAWIVHHDYKDVWFPNEENNLSRLRALFKKNDVPNSFNGALLFSTDELLEYSTDLIAYPYAVFDEPGRLYNDLDISHGKLPVIIKIRGHLNIDLLSSNKRFLQEVVEENASGPFVVREYR